MKTAKLIIFETTILNLHHLHLIECKTLINFKNFFLQFRGILFWVVSMSTIIQTHVPTYSFSGVYLYLTVRFRFITVLLWILWNLFYINVEYIFYSCYPYHQRVERHATLASRKHNWYTISRILLIDGGGM